MMKLNHSKTNEDMRKISFALCVLSSSCHLKLHHNEYASQHVIRTLPTLEKHAFMPGSSFHHLNLAVSLFIQRQKRCIACDCEDTSLYTWWSRQRRCIGLADDSVQRWVSHEENTDWPAGKYFKEKLYHQARQYDAGDRF